MFQIGLEGWVEMNYVKWRTFSDGEACYQISEADECIIMGGSE